MYKAVVAAPRQQSFLAGRYCAKEALGLFTGIRDPQAIDIVPGVFNQPVVTGEHVQDASISVAHTRRLGAAIAFDKSHPMGLDVELVTPDSRTLIASELTNHERALVGQCSHLSPAEVGFWTMKEALAKAIGTGFTVPLSILEVSTLSFDGPSLRTTFTNFGQYQGYGFSAGDHMFALALPRGTQFTTHPAQPFVRRVRPDTAGVTMPDGMDH